MTILIIFVNHLFSYSIKNGNQHLNVMLLAQRLFSITSRTSQVMLKHAGAPNGPVKKLTNEILNERFDHNKAFGMTILKVVLGFLTCGIYSAYAAGKYVKDIHDALVQDEKEVALIRSVCDGLKQAQISDINKNIEYKFDFNFENKTYHVKLAFDSNTQKFTSICVSDGVDEPSTMSLGELSATFSQNISEFEQAIQGQATVLPLPQDFTTPNKMTPEPEGWVKVLRHTSGVPYAYYVNDEWVSLPTAIKNVEQEGAYKAVTHRGNDYVVLTITSKDIKKYQKLVTFTPEILALIHQNQLQRIVPQIRINETQFLSRDLGPEDLSVQIHSENYFFGYQDFVELAKNLDFLHSKGIAHRDIKPANMFFFDGHIHLTDTDLMGKVGIFPCDNGTMSRLPKVFQNVRCDNNDRTAPMSAYKKDQYSFFVSMIEARYKKRPTTETPPFPGDTIQKFVKALRCDESLQRELLNFLSNPALHALSQPMINYLVAPTTSL